jgi:uncharacterized membrane protein
MYNILYVMCMDKERYNLLRKVVVVAIGIVVSLGAVRHSWGLPMVTVLLGFVVLYTMRRQVTDVLHDERTVAIRAKAASRTLGYMTALTGFLGIALVELSYRGFTEYRWVGYAFAYQANVILGVYALFVWYYGRQMGD